MSRLKKRNYTLEEINIMLAFVIMSPDREGLLQPKKVEQLQDDMLKVMQSFRPSLGLYINMNKYLTVTHWLVSTSLTVLHLTHDSVRG